MAGFTPFKRHANKFKYTPRHYDPLKEEFERRREELRGERRDDSSNSNSEYVPGQYIRRKRMVRVENREQDASKDRKRRLWLSVMAIALFFIFSSMILPKLIGLLGVLSSESTTEHVVDQYHDFDPNAPITVVPNDYVEPTTE